MPRSFMKGAKRCRFVDHPTTPITPVHRVVDLYKEFIEEAAKCYVGALQRDKPDLAGLVVLYAKMSRMRVVSTSRGLAAAEQVLKRIAHTYSEPQLTITNEQLREMLQNEALDALRDFSEACRAETDSPYTAISISCASA